MAMIFAVLIIAVVGLAQAKYTCPSDPSTISPCVCGSSKISCYAFNKDIDLETIFETLSFGLNPGDQTFDTFELNSNTITTLPENVFKGVYFKTIKLDNNPRLTCVDRRAFSGTASYTTQFLAIGTSLSGAPGVTGTDCKLFNALSEIQYLDTVNITGSSITEIPANAFTGVGGQQKYLTTINLSSGQGGSITKIGSNAFSQLTNLQYLDLSYHQVNTIESYAFQFNEPSAKYLTINLEHNQLTGDSFDNSAFDLGDRSTTLILKGNQKLKYLKEEVFLTLLENKARAKNSIDLTGTFLEYDRRNAWLKKDKVELGLQSKLQNAMMSDGGTLWEAPANKFTVGPTAAPTKASPTPSTPSTPSKPSTPSTPSKPSTPSTPSKPSTPSTPSKPSTPSTPSKPSTPSTPSKPSTPSTPSKPSTPSTPSKPTTPSTVPPP